MNTIGIIYATFHQHTPPPKKRYLLTPWSRVLLEKLASLQLVKKFPAFYGTRRFLTALTSARHLSLSWASPIQSSYPNPTSWSSIYKLLTFHVPKRVSLFPLLWHEISSRGTPHPENPREGVVYLRIDLSPEEVSRPFECFITGGFYGQALLAPRPTPNLGGQVIPFSCW